MLRNKCIAVFECNSTQTIYRILNEFYNGELVKFFKMLENSS